MLLRFLCGNQVLVGGSALPRWATAHSRSLRGYWKENFGVASFKSSPSTILRRLSPEVGLFTETASSSLCDSSTLRRRT